MQISSHLEIVAKYSPFWHLKRTKLTDVSEDCLYLNVYTPTLNCNADLPVSAVCCVSAWYEVR